LGQRFYISRKGAKAQNRRLVKTGISRVVNGLAEESSLRLGAFA
jgi:hypothetical protein